MKITGINLHKVAVLAIAWTLSALLLLSGCRSEEVEMPTGFVAATAYGGLDYSVDGALPETRSGLKANEVETKLTHCWLLFFTDTTGGGDGRLHSWQRVAVQPGAKSLAFSVNQLNAGANYRLLAIGNADCFLPRGETSFGTYLRHLKEAGLKYDNAWERISTGVEYPEGTVRNLSLQEGCLPMYGRLMTADPSKEGSAQETCFKYTMGLDAEGNAVPVFSGHLFFKRSVCRIELRNLVGRNLDIQAVKVCNYRDCGYPFAVTPPEGEEDIATLQSNEDGDSNIKSRTGYMPASEVSEGIQTLLGALYCYPNESAQPKPGDRVTTCLMIAGYYSPPGGEKEKKLTYYRLNIRNFGDMQSLRRNNCYRATVKGIARRGCDTEREAFELEREVIDASFAEDWEIEDGNFASDGREFISVSKSQLTLPALVKGGRAESLKVECSGGLEWSCALGGSETADREFGLVKGTDMVSVSALADNREPRYRMATLTVEGRYRDQPDKTPLRIEVQVMQLTTSSEIYQLTVQGRTGGRSNPVVPGTGVFDGQEQALLLNVKTGSKHISWKCEAVEGWSGFTGGSYTTMGADGGTLEIELPPFYTQPVGQREALFRVFAVGELPEGVSMPDVYVKVVQKSAPILIRVYKEDGTEVKEGETIVIDALDFTPGVPNGIAATGARRFKVESVIPEGVWRVHNYFNRYQDLVVSPFNLSKDSSVKATIAAAGATVTQMNATDRRGSADWINGDSFWVNAFRTGPGDPTITNRIQVVGICGSYTAALNFYIQIRTEETLLDDIIWEQEANGVMTPFLYPDRNYGVPSAAVTAENYVIPKGVSPLDAPALNYHYDPNLKITGKSDSEYVLGRNFRGNIATHSSQPNGLSVSGVAGNITMLKGNSPRSCYNEGIGYTMPSNSYSDSGGPGWKNDMTIIGPMLQQRARFSKCRCYIVSQYGYVRNGQKIRVCCWQPIVNGRFTYLGGNWSNSWNVNVYGSVLTDFNRGSAWNYGRGTVVIDYVNGTVAYYANSWLKRSSEGYWNTLWRDACWRPCLRLRPIYSGVSSFQIPNGYYAQDFYIEGYGYLQKFE